MRPEFGFRIVPSLPWIEKWQWRHNFPTWHHRQVFLTFFCCFFFVKLSYLSNFHVNIITGSGVMIIFFYKGLTRNPEIGYNPAWVLPNIWEQWRVRDTKFGTNVSNEMLLNVAKCQLRLLSLLSYWEKTNREDKITPPPVPITQNRVKLTFCPIK